MRSGKRRGLALLVPIVILCGLIGCGGSGSGDIDRGDGTTKPGGEWQLRPVPWKMYGPPEGRKVRIISEVGYCTGTARPRFRDVRSEERGRRVYVTAILATPKRSRGAGCAGVAIGVQKVVTLHHALGGRTVYDSSQSPPARRWPAPRANRGAMDR